MRPVKGILFCAQNVSMAAAFSAAIETFCAQNKIPFTGRIPYDRHVPEAVNAGHSVADIDCPAKDALRAVYERTISILNQ